MNLVLENIIKKLPKHEMDKLRAVKLLNKKYLSRAFFGFLSC